MYIIFQDFLNRGYSKERAAREVQKSFNAGTDIDDAKTNMIKMVTKKKLLVRQL